MLRRGEAPDEVWPEHWGITLAQCQEFTEECIKDPSWRSSNTVYNLVEDYVKPRTEGTGMGYALLRNEAAPLEVNVMVSHTWAENAEEFFRTLERSVKPHDVLFICALSLYQNEDGAGPTIAQQLGMSASESPFRRVLDHILMKGEAAGWRWRWRPWLHFVPKIVFTLALFLYYYTMGVVGCVPTLLGQCAVGGLPEGTNIELDYIGSLCFMPKWTFHFVPLDLKFKPMPAVALMVFMLSVILSYTEDRWTSSYHGRMVAVPNTQCDLYNRLWCVYEIFVATKLGVPVELARTLARAGRCQSKDAVCGSMEDMERIRGEIEAWGKASLMKRSSSTITALSLAGAGKMSFKSFKSILTPKTPQTVAYGTVDSAITLVTRRAQRSILCAMVAWIAPFSVLSLAVPEGDFLVPSQFFGTVICTGVQSLIIVAVILVVVLFIVARRSFGNPECKTLLLVAGLFVIMGCGLRVFDACDARHYPGGPTNYPPLHHCFTTYIISSGISLALLALGAQIMGAGFIRWRWRAHFMALIAVVMLTVVVLSRVSSFTAGQIVPMTIWYASFRIMPHVGYPTCVWLFAARWGVDVRREPLPPGSKGYSRQTSSASAAS